MTGAAGPIPCAVVTGALGAGKTTVIKALMQRPSMAGTALVINEFGEVGLDHLLVSTAVETTMLLENGCMCCSLRGDLVDTVLSLFAGVERGEIPRFERILIETTGLADPVPVVRDLTAAEALRGKVRLAGVVTCVDALIGQTGLAGDPVAVSQVAQADTCLVTKTDLADPLAIDRLVEELGRINPIAAISRFSEGALPDADIVFGDNVSPVPLPQGGGTPDHGHAHDHARGGPHTGIESWSAVIDRPLPWARLMAWLDLVYSLHAARMLRMKGILWVEDRECPVLVQAVGPVVAPPRPMAEWPDGARLTRLVIIAKGLGKVALDQSFRDHVLQARALTGARGGE